MRDPRVKLARYDTDRLVIMLRRLAWSSVPSRAFCAAHLVEIAASSRRNNERHHVSGMLLVTGRHFLGVLEGQEWDLEKLWLRLTRDERHGQLIRIGSELCGARWFPHWIMRYRNNAAVSSDIRMLRSPPAPLGSTWVDKLRPIMLPGVSVPTGGAAPLTVTTARRNAASRKLHLPACVKQEMPQP